VAARFGILLEDAAELEAAERLLDEGVAAETEPDVDEGGLAEAA
jgi:hypothetical protein